MYFDLQKSTMMTRPDGPVYISRTYKRWNLKKVEFKYDGPVLIQKEYIDEIYRFWMITNEIDWDNDRVEAWAERHGIDEYDMSDEEILMMACELAEN